MNSSGVTLDRNVVILMKTQLVSCTTKPTDDTNGLAGCETLPDSSLSVMNELVIIIQDQPREDRRESFTEI
jgi:hypothetical protein